VLLRGIKKELQAKVFSDFTQHISNVVKMGLQIGAAVKKIEPSQMLMVFVLTAFAVFFGGSLIYRHLYRNKRIVAPKVEGSRATSHYSARILR
jgi:hypothetical protein